METTLDSVIGSDLLAMTRRFRDWVPRREERFDYLNHAIVRRTVRVDVDIAGFYSSDAEAPLWRGLTIVPIAVLRRDRHTTVEVRIEDGSLVPRLTFHEERRFLFLGVLELASFLLGQELVTEPTREALFKVVHGPPGSEVPDTEQMRRMRQQSEEFSLALDLVSNFYYLLVPLDPRSGSRRVVTYSYLEPIVPSAVNTQAVIDAAFGVDAHATDCAGERRISAEVPGPGHCRSYHLEVAAPPALRIVDALLRVQDNTSGSAPTDAVDNDRLETHAHMRIGDLNGLVWGAYTCRMVLPSTGTVRTAVASTLFTLVSLSAVAALIWLPGPIGFVSSNISQDAGTSIFLLIPAIAGPALAATSNHGLTTSLLLETRFTMWLSGVASFVAAGAVAVGLQGALRVLAWGSALALAAWCSRRVWTQYTRLRNV